MYVWGDIMKKDDIRTSYGMVRNINSGKIKNTKLYKKAAVVIATASIIAVVALTSAGCMPKQISEIPSDQIKYTITIQVNADDTISDIADKFYNDDCDNVYNSVSNYKNEIINQNNLSKTGFIKAGSKIDVPVIIDKDNPYYLRIQEIEEEIKSIEENELWVKYTVEYGDTVTTIASFASGNYYETYDIANKIISKNSMRNGSILNAGEKIWIMNPKLGDLKLELNNLNEDLKLSLMGEQMTR